MSLKELLGLESFAITEGEIMHQLEDAYRNKRDEIEFSSPKKRVRIRLSQVAAAGVMKEY